MADLYPGPITDDEEEIPVRPGLRNLAAMAGEAPPVVPPAYASRSANQQAPTQREYQIVRPTDNMAPPAVSGSDAPPAMPLGRTGPSAPDFNADVMAGSVAPPVYNEPKPRLGRSIGSTLLSLAVPSLGARIAEAPIARAQREYAAQKDQYDTAMKQGTEQQNQESINTLRKAQADEANARAKALAAPPADKQGLTPEETTIHDLMSGDNGKPRVNPQTGKPYTYLEAYGAVKQAAEDTKPEKPEPPNVYADWKKEHPNGTVEEWEKEIKPPKPEKDTPPSPFTRALSENAAKDVATANGADFRWRSMSDSYPKALKGDQQAMVNLLTNHIGMTLGMQKGARITKDILHEAQSSTPWLQGVKAKFDKNGYLSGVTLTPEQMAQMMDLAKSQRSNAWQQVADSSRQAGVGDEASKMIPKDLQGSLSGAPEQYPNVKIADGWHWTTINGKQGITDGKSFRPYQGNGR